MKFQQLVTSYLSLRTVRPPTASTYRYYVKRVTDHTQIDTPRACTIETAIAFRDALLKTSKPVTWNSARRHLIALWKHAIKLKLTKTNPWSELRPGQVFAKAKTVKDDDFAAALAFLTTHSHRFKPARMWHTLFLTFADTGMRRSQLVGLNWGDLNFIKGTILLRASTSKTHREYTVPISNAIVAGLLQLRCDALACWGNEAGFEESQVFNVRLHRTLVPQAESLTNDAVTKFFTRLATLSQSSLSCHRLRHRIATRLLEKNSTHVKNVQALLGHTDVATTLGYVSPDLRALKAAIESLWKIN